MIFQVLQMLNMMKKSKETPKVPKVKARQRFSFKANQLSNSIRQEDHCHGHSNVTENREDCLNGKNDPKKNHLAKIHLRNGSGHAHDQMMVHDHSHGQMGIPSIADNPEVQNNSKNNNFLPGSVNNNFHSPLHNMAHVYPNQPPFYGSNPPLYSPMNFPSNQGDMNSFYQMHGMQNNSQMRSNQSMMNLNKNHHFCTEHQTIANMVCLTDYKVICSNCALFGVHKGHDYCKFDSFKEKCQVKFKELKTEMEKTEFKWYIQEGGKEGDAIKKKVKEKKEELCSQVDGIFEVLLKKMRDRQEELKKEVNDKFRKFERIINLRVSHHKNIKERVERFNEKLEVAETNFGSLQMDFKSMFEILFQKGPKNAFEEIEKISQEIEIEKNNNSSFVEKELSRYKIEYEQSAVNSFIKNNMARLACEVSSMGESLRNVTSLGNSYDRNFMNKTPEKKKQRKINIIKFDKEDSFEMQLANNIQISKDIELMGSNFGSKIFSNINMCEFLKKNEPEKDAHENPNEDAENIFKAESKNLCSKTERKQKKSALDLEIIFSEKKKSESSEKICEEEIDTINNSQFLNKSNLMSPTSKNETRRFPQEGKNQIMSFLENEHEEENLMDSSIPQSGRSFVLNESEISFTPKKNFKIVFEPIPNKDLNESDLIKSATKETNNQEDFPSDNSRSNPPDNKFINMLKKSKKTKKTKLKSGQETTSHSRILTDICLNKSKGSMSMRNMNIKPKTSKKSECEPLNLYNRMKKEAPGKKNKINMHSSNFMGLASTEQLYTEKPKNLLKRGKRLKRAGTQSTSMIGGGLKIAKKIGSSTKKIDLRKKKGSTKSINGMTSLIQFKKKPLRIQTEHSNNHGENR